MLLLAWAQLLFSTVALVGRAQHFSHTWFDHLCYTLSNTCRLLADCTCVAVGAAATERLLRGTGEDVLFLRLRRRL